MSGRRTGPGGSAELSAAQATQETPMDRPTRSAFSDAISSIEEIIEDARNGRMFILVDHEDRENEGDLVIPAQMCTPDAINFMATHGARADLPRAPRRAARRAGAAADGGVELVAARDRLHRLDRGARGRHDRHLGPRPGAHGRGGDRPALGAAGHRDAGPRLPAPRARRRGAGPRRPYRGRGRYRRASPG